MTAPRELQDLQNKASLMSKRSKLDYQVYNLHGEKASGQITRASIKLLQSLFRKSETNT